MSMLPITVLATATKTITPPIVQTIETFTYISIGFGALGVGIGFLVWLTIRRAK
ncbi:hypothetical protein [Saccharolobus islandicus]|uniref:Uncharacterized protein n=2 Tax=Saccharolobus islandicus TaxID=43080 RepID=M9U3U2_SACIS|nr:hypothetical protein [Sulfolobus islandicus]AGJ61684.1 Hypothetical Protein SiL_0205 [Sulfolobus islandicus LAL14/1]